MSVELPVTKKQVSETFATIFLMGFLYWAYPFVDGILHTALRSNYWDFNEFIPVVFVGAGIAVVFNWFIGVGFVKFQKEDAKPKYKYKLVKVPVEQ